MPFSKVLNQSLTSKSGQNQVKLPRKDKSSTKEKKTKNDEKSQCNKERKENSCTNSKQQTNLESDVNDAVKGSADRNKNQASKSDQTSNINDKLKSQTEVTPSRKYDVMHEIDILQNCPELMTELEMREKEELESEKDSEEEGILLSLCKEYSGEDIVELIKDLIRNGELSLEIINEVDKSGRVSIFFYTIIHVFNISFPPNFINF